MNRITFSESIARPGRRTWSIPATPHALALACALRLLQPQRAGAEDHFDLKHEWYAEDDHRVEVNTTALEIEKKLAAATIARAKLVYDSISGASPTGGPPPAGSSQVPVKELHDIRRAVNFDLSQQWGRHTLTPSFAYSLERDYESYGVGYTHAIDFNQKNTTLSLGVAGAFDSIFAKPLHGTRGPGDTEFSK